MTTVRVEPAEFSIVHYDTGRIAALVSDVAALVGLPGDLTIAVDIDEHSPFGRTEAVLDGRMVTVAVQSGAFEDLQHLRHFSDVATRLVLGRVLFRVRDRLDPAFGRPPPDADLSLVEHVAWDAYALGRYARRAGVDGGRARRLYAFRLRRGFDAETDRAFDQLWDGSDLTWADIHSLCA